MTTNVIMGREGEISLPTELRDRYGLVPETPIRVVETRSGILLVPLTGESPSASLQQELEEWQEASAQSWALFPYESDET